MPRFLCTLLVAGLAQAAQAADRYVAMFTDGQRTGHDEVRDWHDTAAQPKLNDRPLFDPERPVRWLIDTELSFAPQPEAFVELVGGDRLPGHVTEYRTGQESPYNQTPPHVLVDPEVAVQWPDPRQRRSVRVLARWLRRVVWQARSRDDYQPGTVFYLDGRQVAFRSLRWNESSVRLLLADGTSEVAFSQIAELHLPRQDPWNAWFEQLALLDASGASRLVQVETDSGIRVTASTERFQARNNGSHTDHWYHGFQPAWSLEPLWLRHRGIRTRLYFEPHELPLSRLEPAKAVQESALSGGWRWQMDRNVQGGPLRIAGADYGWGLGVHAACSLAFDLHPLARSFQCRVGLDDVAGRGGCARGRVYWLASSPNQPEAPPKGNNNQPAASARGNSQPSEKPAFKSPLLIGSSESFETGVLTPPAPATAAESPSGSRLILEADAVLQDRPAGSDPLDIRDTLNWLEPLVVLDPQGVQEEIARRTQRHIPAWQGWSLAESESGPAQVVNYWDDTDVRNLRFQPLVAARQRLVLVTRRIEVTAENSKLLLAASRFGKETAPARLQVQVDGQQVAQFDVPERRSPNEPDPLLVPLDRYIGREITLGVAQLPLGPKSLVDWRGIHLTDSWPGLHRIFEDEAQLAEDLRLGTENPALDAFDKHAGESSLKFTPVAGSDPHRIELQIAIRENPKLGEFRYLRFAWKKRGGGRICLSLGHDDTWGPADDVPLRERSRRSFRYEAGQGEPSYGAAMRLGPAPQEWTVVTRDLFADFGAFDLTGLSLSAPDGEAAWFDHIYLGRAPADFERIKDAR